MGSLQFLWVVSWFSVPVPNVGNSAVFYAHVYNYHLEDGIFIVILCYRYSLHYF